MTFICVECGSRATTLYTTPVGGSFELTRCESCGGVVDKYLEYETSLVALDIMLHRPQAYRHLLYNESSVASIQTGVFLELRHFISNSKTFLLCIGVVIINACVKCVVLDKGARFWSSLSGVGADSSNGDRSQLMWYAYLLFVSACEGMVCLACMCGVIWIVDATVCAGVALRASVHRTAMTMVLSESFKCLALLIFPYELCSRHSTEGVVHRHRTGGELGVLYNFVGLTVLLANTSALCVLLPPMPDRPLIGTDSVVGIRTAVVIATLIAVETLSRSCCRYFLFGFDKDDLFRLGLL